MYVCVLIPVISIQGMSPALNYVPPPVGTTLPIVSDETLPVQCHVLRKQPFLMTFRHMFLGQETVIKLVDREILLKEREEKLRVRRTITQYRHSYLSFHNGT